MTAFVWIDRDGQRRELYSPAPIEAEAADIALEMDRYIDIQDGADPLLRDTARAAIGKLQPRLERLRDDLAGWNDHALVITRAEAVKLAEQIDRLPTMLGDIPLVVGLHSEHDRIIAITSGSPEMLARMLAEPMTAVQRQAIAACASRTAPADTATRGDAKAWLDHQPRFARGGQVDGGWFAWIDRNGHAHRLTGPLSIEREVAAVANELTELRRTLVGTPDPAALYAAVISGIASWERLQILKGDLERFDREATAREDAAWTAYTADWRSKRKMK